MTSITNHTPYFSSQDDLIRYIEEEKEKLKGPGGSAIMKNIHSGINRLSTITHHKFPSLIDSILNLNDSSKQEKSEDNEYFTYTVKVLLSAEQKCQNLSIKARCTLLMAYSKFASNEQCKSCRTSIMDHFYNSQFTREAIFDDLIQAFSFANASEDTILRDQLLLFLIEKHLQGFNHFFPQVAVEDSSCDEPAVSEKSISKRLFRALINVNAKDHLESIAGESGFIENKTANPRSFFLQKSEQSNRLLSIFLMTYALQNIMTLTPNFCFLALPLLKNTAYKNHPDFPNINILSFNVLLKMGTIDLNDIPFDRGTALGIESMFKSLITSFQKEIEKHIQDIDSTAALLIKFQLTSYQEHPTKHLKLQEQLVQRGIPLAIENKIIHLLNREHNIAEAKKYLDQLESLTGLNSNMLMAKAEILACMGQHDEANRIVQGDTNIDMEYPVALKLYFNIVNGELEVANIKLKLLLSQEIRHQINSSYLTYYHLFQGILAHRKGNALACKIFKQHYHKLESLNYQLQHPLLISFISMTAWDLGLSLNSKHPIIPRMLEDRFQGILTQQVAAVTEKKLGKLVPLNSREIISFGKIMGEKRFHHIAFEAFKKALDIKDIGFEAKEGLRNLRDLAPQMTDQINNLFQSHWKRSQKMANIIDQLD